MRGVHHAERTCEELILAYQCASTPLAASRFAATRGDKIYLVSLDAEGCHAYCICIADRGGPRRDDSGFGVLACRDAIRLLEALAGERPWLLLPELQEAGLPGQPKTVDCARLMGPFCAVAPSMVSSTIG